MREIVITEECPRCRTLEQTNRELQERIAELTRSSAGRRRMTRIRVLVSALASALAVLNVGAIMLTLHRARDAADVAVVVKRSPVAPVAPPFRRCSRWIVDVPPTYVCGRRIYVWQEMGPATSGGAQVPYR